MATYIAITDAETDPEAPITSELAKKWRDNPLAGFEKDTSVPVGLRLGHWLLGTLNTPSGANTYTLSGLDLSTYEFLLLVSNGVASRNINIAGINFRTGLGSDADPTAGVVLISLRTGVGSGAFSPLGVVPEFYVRDTGITQATTSVTLTGSINFSGGSMLFYGVR